MFNAIDADLAVHINMLFFLQASVCTDMDSP